MKQVCVIVMFIGLFLTANSQTKSEVVLSPEYIKTKASYFRIDNNKIEGEGKQVIEDLVNESQFITWGEVHNSKQTSVVTKALMPLLHKADFKHFAIEVGPNSAEKLTELSSPFNETVKNLKAFYSKYTVTQGGESAIPIPFFDGVADAQFLEVARKNKMSLWGLDQEYYFGAFFLIDELMATVKSSSNYSTIEQKKNVAMQIMYKHFVDETQEKNDNAYSLIVKEKAVNNFFAAFSIDNAKAQKIITDLKISWDIYIRWRDDSHADRISYMRDNFLNAYNKASKNEKKPKVFTKIGSLHASELMSNGAFDIGNLTEELARKNKTISTTINTWRIFSRTNDTIQNNTEKYKGYKRYKLFTDLAKQDQWAIINLREIRNDLEKGIIKLPVNGDYHKLKALIYGYDYQILIPVDEQDKPNRN